MPTVPTPPEKFRVAGSGLTVFVWNNQPIGFAQSVSETSPQPVAAPEAIQPMDASHPVEILVPQAIGPGTLQIQLFERFNSKVWDDMLKVIDNTRIDGDNGFNRFNRQNNGDGRQLYHDLRDIFNRMANLDRGVTAQKRVYAPDRIGQKKWQADIFYNVRITDVRDDEDINIGTMSVVKSMSMMYTHKQRSEFGQGSSR